MADCAAISATVSRWRSSEGKTIGVDLNALVDAAVAGDRRSLARLLSAFDDGDAGIEAAARRLAPHAGRAHVVGITGVPGSGKSTLVNALLGAWLGRGERVAVVAVDPSSPFTGGAVLGDRIRMGEHGAHPNAFVRSFSARGELGGLSRAVRGAVDALDAAGFHRVVVETVGTGQSETSIASLADTRVVVVPPGLGDDVQAIKAGTLEIADVFAVSKGDLPFADRAARQLREMQQLRRAPRDDPSWMPPVVVVEAMSGGGIEELVGVIDEHGGEARRGRRLRARTVHPQQAATADATGNIAARLRDLAAADGLCSALGIELVSGGAGQATVAMTVDARHLNFNGGCHGGAVFALADSAFGLASNSHGPLASGIDAHITYMTGVRAGERLVARAHEVQRRKRIAVYRIEVVRVDAGGSEALVSTFTGTVSIRA